MASATESPPTPLEPTPPGTAPAAKPVRSPWPKSVFPPFSYLHRFRTPLNRGVIGVATTGTPQHRCAAAGGAAGQDLLGAACSHDLSARRNQTSLFSPPGPPTLLGSDLAVGNAEFSLLPDPAIAQGSQQPGEQEWGAAGAGCRRSGVPPLLLPQLPNEVLSPPRQVSGVDGDEVVGGFALLAFPPSEQEHLGGRGTAWGRGIAIGAAVPSLPPHCAICVRLGPTGHCYDLAQVMEQR